MLKEPIAAESAIPPQSVPNDAHEFNERVHGLLDGQAKDEATTEMAFGGFDEMFDLIAADMYSIASMMVGEGEDSVRLVETALADGEVASAHDPVEARENGRRALCAAALDTLASRDSDSLAAPQGLEHAVTCIDDDELDMAGVSSEELGRMIAGPDRDRVRNWLESLPTATRVIFALRAVAGFTASETADLIQVHGGPRAAGWSEDAVRELFRQGLCSLAGQVLHEANR